MLISWGILRQGNGSMVTARNLSRQAGQVAEKVFCFKLRALPCADDFSRHEQT